MPQPTVKDLVTIMTRDILAPELKSAGFRRTGRVFWRNTPHVCHLAAITLSRWGNRHETSFTVQLGVFWHRVEQILKNPSAGKLPPRIDDCTFRIELSRIVSMPPKLPWEVTESSDFTAVGRDVLNNLLTHGLPWFDYRSDLKRSLEWKRYTTPLRNGLFGTQELVLPTARTVFKVMLGKKREAAEDLKRFAANGDPNDAQKLAHRLGIKTRGVDGASRKTASRKTRAAQ